MNRSFLLFAAVGMFLFGGASSAKAENKWESAIGPSELTAACNMSKPNGVTEVNRAIGGSEYVNCFSNVKIEVTGSTEGEVQAKIKAEAEAKGINGSASTVIDVRGNQKYAAVIAAVTWSYRLTEYCQNAKNNDWKNKIWTGRRHFVGDGGFACYTGSIFDRG